MDPKMATFESSKVVRSKDILGEKWDKCLSQGFISMTFGLAIGK